MFSALLTSLLLLLHLPFLTAIPISDPSYTASSSLSKRCTNALQNPSFEYGEYPWLLMGFGAWSTRGIYTSSEGGHDGRNFFYGHSNATIGQATTTVSQSGLNIPAGTTVDCSAWIASSRPGNVGATRVEVFLDGVTCGGVGWFGSNGWEKVGGQVQVQGDSHTLAVVASSDGAGEDGWSVWIDDVWVGVGC